MNNLYYDRKIEQVGYTTHQVGVAAGASIADTITEAIGLASRLVCAVRFEFNGVTVTVHSDSNPETVLRDWRRALEGYIDKAVGPHPNPDLTDEERENDARVEAKNELRRQKYWKELDEKARLKRERVEALLATAPAIELANEDERQKFQEMNSDSYAERWARLMQVEMAKGAALEEVAEATSHEADLNGASGVTYSCAVAALAHYWKHGDRLRRWHNLAYQIGNEGEAANKTGGVLNTALLSLG